MEHFVWDVSPEIFRLGAFGPRYYGLLFGLGFFVGYRLMRKMVLAEGYSEEELQSLLTYMVVGTIVGARLGHCLFYEPAYYLSNPIEILKIWKGGLASHGGSIGVLLACYLFKRKNPQHSYLWLADRLSIGTAFTAGCIRLGNFFNSEILGKETDVPWGIVFKRVDDVVRHPAMLYESAAYFLLFIVIYGLYLKWRENTPQGRILGILLVWVFTARILIENFKENQVAFEQDMAFNMGQLLSIPFIIIGILFITGKMQAWLPSLTSSQSISEEPAPKKTSTTKKKKR